MQKSSKERTISNDMNVKQRQDYKILRKPLYLAKEDENINCYMKNNKLCVNGKMYSVEDSDQSEKVEEIGDKAIGAPGTPSAQNYTKGDPKVFEKSLVTNTRNQKTNIHLIHSSPAHRSSEKISDEKRLRC
ncbi:hypothetical protein JTB14_012853 [Gonioctena quinquepunctata]|nr:hypothetical protein JTB14_012853 [Gonioctena quinquepunctata]